MSTIFLVMSTDSVPYALIDIKTSREKAEALCKSIEEYQEAPPNGTEAEYDEWDEKHPGITDLRDQSTNIFHAIAELDRRNTTVIEYEVEAGHFRGTICVWQLIKPTFDGLYKTDCGKELMICPQDMRQMNYCPECGGEIVPDWVKEITPGGAPNE